MTIDPRLERIELHLDKLGEKIDGLTKVVIDMAKIEERMINLFGRIDKYEEKQSALEERLREIEKVTSSRGVVFKMIDKLVWILIGVFSAAFLGGFLS